MERAVRNTLIGAVALIGVFAAGWFLRPKPPQLDPHPPRTDTLYYPLDVFREKLELHFEKGDDVVFTDTVKWPYVVERIVTDTQYVGWELPWTWGVDRLEPPVSPGDSLLVSLHGLKVDSLTGVQRTARMEKIWAPGYLRYLEVDEEGELRLDFEPFEDEGGTSKVLRWIERGAFVALGALLF
jgi:hypothetical protein